MSALSATVTKSSGSGSGGVLLIVLVAVVLVFLVLNGRRKSKAAASQQAAIEVGAMVVTRAGLIATLVEQTDAYVVLQLEDGTRARYLPQAIARVWVEPVSAGVPDDATDLAPRPHPGGEPPTGSGPLAD